MARAVLAFTIATFWAYFVLTVYSDWYGPEAFGAYTRITDDGLVLTSVNPGSVIARAGLAEGDLLTTVDGRRGDNVLAWTTALARRVPGESIAVTVERAGVPGDVRLQLLPRGKGYWRSVQPAILMSERAIQLLTLVVASMVAIRAQTVTALSGALFLATIAVFSTTRPPGFVGFWSMLPLPVSAALLLPHQSIVSIGGVLFAFCATFGRRRWSRAAVVLLAAPWLVFLVWELWFASRLLYDPTHAPIEGHPVRAIVALNVTYVAIALVTLSRNYWRLNSVTERRRVRLVVAGTMVGTLCGAPAIITLWLGPAGGPFAFFEPPLSVQVGYSAFLIVPVCLWWAIARHQLYDVSFVVRRGLQYMLARQALLVVTPFAVFLVGAELWMHDGDSIASVVRQHSAVYAAIGLTLVMVGWRRASWLDSLDRRFFRERYDACQVLRAVAGRARRAQDFRSTATSVVDEIKGALHLEWAAVLVSERGSFRLCAGTMPLGEPWPSTLSLLTFLRAVGRPVEIDTTANAWLTQHVPEKEIDFFHRLRASLIVPICAAEGGLDAIIALGAKKSEEPFSLEDRNLLMAIAETLTTLLPSGTDPPGSPTPPSGEIDLAAVSGPLLELADSIARGDVPDWHQLRLRLSPDEWRHFEAFQELFELLDDRSDVVSPSSVAAAPTGPEGAAGRRWGKCQLFECIGAGSVGSVWRARDELDRTVAVKLLREDLTDKGQLLEEAKRLARVRHINVVNVYGAGEYDGVSGFWMEMIEGQTLASLVRSRGCLGPGETVMIGKTLCAALAAIHDAGLVHQDVKPQNIMREGWVDNIAPNDALADRDGGSEKRRAHTGRYVLMDLGAGVDITASAPPRWGTPEYMAPEVLMGERATVQSDLYSLGVLLFFLLTGDVPVSGTTLEQIRDAHRRSQRRWLRDLQPNLPVQLVEAVDRALAAAPERRCESVGEFAHALML